MSGKLVCFGEMLVRLSAPYGEMLLQTPRLASHIGGAEANVAICVSRLGGKDGPGLETGKFLSPHGLAVDSKGDIYVGEVGYTNWPTSYPDVPRPAHLRTLQKLERVR